MSCSPHGFTNSYFELQNFMIFISFTSCEQPILRNTNFCLFTFWVFLPGKSFEYQQLYSDFLVYFNLNSKLLPGKYIQNLNKQKICCKNSEFILVVRMSWTEIENSTSKNRQKWNEMTAYTIHEVGNNLELIRLLWATIVNLLLNGGARIDPNKL